MNKQELEHVLLDPARVASLVERAKSLAVVSRHGSESTKPMAAVRPNARANEERRPNSAEIHANDRDFMARSGAVLGLSKFTGDRIHTAPRAAIRAIVTQNRTVPTPPERWLLEDAINCLLIEGNPDPDTEKFLQSAMRVVEQDPASVIEKGGGM